MSSNEFAIIQEFKDGYRYIKRVVTGDEAMTIADTYCNNLGTQLGIVSRVLVLKSGTQTCFEWKVDKGITFPQGVTIPVKEEYAS